MIEICGDNRFEIIDAAKKDLLESTNINTSPDEMKVLDNFLFRCWQMGRLDKMYSSSKVFNNSKKEKLVITMPAKEGDIKHICYEGGCPFFLQTKDGDMGLICKTLWSTPPKGKSQLASLCNYYDTKNITIEEL